MSLGHGTKQRHIKTMAQAVQTDVFISGGGVAGLTAAAAFGAAGFSVVCAEPHPPVTNAADEGADLRTTAFLQPARDLLAEAGLWQTLAPHATPLQVMRLIDAGGADAAPRITRDFDASELSDAPFGWNLPNWLLRREMVARLASMQNVTLRVGPAFAGMTTRQTEAVITLTDGSRLRARLVIAADGRGSAVRASLGIPVTTTRYGQKAITFAVTHPIPHGNTSTEVHRTGGPFTLVPLPDRDGMPCSAVVWMETGPEAARLMSLDEAAFADRASARSTHCMGPLTLASRRATWPIISQLAASLTGERTALIAEAAHVVPPIGAQGLNMSLADIAALLTLAKASHATLGNEAMLDAYARARMPDLRLRVAGIDALNRAAIAQSPFFRDLRAAGLRALTAADPVRKALMRTGLGLR